MTDTGLKPCPCCKGVADSNLRNTVLESAVGCTNCGLKLEYIGELGRLEAIEAWNTRADLAPVTPQQAVINDLQALIDVVEDETGALSGLCSDEPDEEPVAIYGDGRPAPMTFGHVRRAQAALKAIKEQAE